ncbi:MAG: PQQ-dependent sugar dehydrogenase [Vicinamibacteria bacterium]
MCRILFASLAALVVAAPAAGAAVTLEPVGSFTSPVYVTSEPGDPDRLLVVEQGGTIQFSDHGVVSPFLDLSEQVDDGGERGLLSMALAPDFATSGHFYVYYTRDGPASDLGDIQIDEYTASGTSASVATRRPVLTIDHSAFANHNGGQLQFGPDGYLYIATGDGGSAGDPSGNGRNLNTLLGKLLRIDPRQAGSEAYSIPAGNPYAGATPGLDEIWSYGLRNPWRFSFDRLTGDLTIGDVGQGAREEVDYERAPSAGRGVNFGWNCREGLIAYSGAPGGCTGLTGFTDPIHDYTHAGGNCAITGGYVVRDQSLGDLYGRYLFSDACGGEIRSLVPGLPLATGVRSEDLSVSLPSSFGQDSCGRLYVTSLGGQVSRFTGAHPADCSAVTAPTTPPRCAGKPATRVLGESANLLGSPGDDVIVADGRENRIQAGRGDDIVCGLAGRDVLKGGPGDDRLRGGRGDDRCRGRGGKDRVRSC